MEEIWLLKEFVLQILSDTHANHKHEECDSYVKRDDGQKNGQSEWKGCETTSGKEEIECRKFWTIIKMTAMCEWEDNMRKGTSLRLNSGDRLASRKTTI